MLDLVLHKTHGGGEVFTRTAYDLKYVKVKNCYPESRLAAPHNTATGHRYGEAAL